MGREPSRCRGGRRGGQCARSAPGGPTPTGSGTVASLGHGPVGWIGQRWAEHTAPEPGLRVPTAVALPQGTRRIPPGRAPATRGGRIGSREQQPRSTLLPAPSGHGAVTARYPGTSQRGSGGAVRLDGPGSRCRPAGRECGRRTDPVARLLGRVVGLRVWPDAPLRQPRGVGGVALRSGRRTRSRRPVGRCVPRVAGRGGSPRGRRWCRRRRWPRRTGCRLAATGSSPS